MQKKTRTVLYKLPSTVVALVEALCADYWRRERALRGGVDDIVLRAEFIKLNAAVDQAMDEVELSVRESLLSDIGSKCGYRRSRLSLIMSKPAYYRRKGDVIRKVAKNLNWI